MLNAQPLPARTKHLFPSRFMAWQRQGLSARAAGALALAGCDTVEDITRLGRIYFEGRPNCAAKTLAELAALAGWPPERRTAADAIAQALMLAVNDPAEALEAAQDALIALRRAGFFVVATKSAPGGTR